MNTTNSPFLICGSVNEVKLFNSVAKICLFVKFVSRQICSIYKIQKRVLISKKLISVKFI